MNFLLLDANKSEPVLDRNSFNAAYAKRPITTRESQNRKRQDKQEKAAENIGTIHTFKLVQIMMLRKLIEKITVNNVDHTRDNAVPFDPDKTTADMLSVYNRESKIPPKIFENTQTFHERTNRHTVIVDTGDLNNALVTNVEQIQLRDGINGRLIWK